MATQVITVPDIGGATDVDVIEVCVAPGDTVVIEQSLIVLETDKASMEVPSTVAGKVIGIKVKEGDTVSEGDAIVEVEVDAVDGAAQTGSAAEQSAPVAEQVADTATESTAAATAKETAVQSTAQPQSAAVETEIHVPDLGGAEDVDVIEVCVAEGDDVAEGDSLIVLETDKASMEVPSTVTGKLISLSVKEGDTVSEGSLIGTVQTTGSTVSAGTAEASATQSQPAAAPSPEASAPAPATSSTNKIVPFSTPAPVNGEEADKLPETHGVYAGPSVRKLARQLGVDLRKVTASGPRKRHTKNDIRDYVKKLVADQGKPTVSGGGIMPVPEIDFSQFGDIELVKMSKIKKITATNMTRSWLNVPHVTQFDEADITDLEAFRKDMKAQAEKKGVKLTPLPFLLKACAAALRYEPSFNVSMHADGEHIVQKNYVHIGVAVAAPAGLMVPVIRDVDKKGLWELAAEASELAKKARDGKLLPKDMQGGCFTISSLGAMGGTGFTPIVNTPEVGILAVSKAQIKPVWNGSEFVPRQMLPLSVSYDHRAINGADAGRFFTYLSSVLGDIRQLLL